MVVGPTERFAALVRAEGPQLPLDEAVLLVAAHARPGLDVDAWRSRLDGVADECAGVQDAAALARRLFVDLGFAGNTHDYGDPENSLLSSVVGRRLGIPITLTILMMEVGRRIGVDVVGIGMPGHFLARDAHDTNAFFDPFDHGRALDVEGCQDRFAAVHGPDVAFEPSYLDVTPPRAIVRRVLANLERAYLARRPTDVVWVARLELSFADLPAGERRRIARLLGALGRFEDGAAALEPLLATADGETARRLASEAAGLRARSN